MRWPTGTRFAVLLGSLILIRALWPTSEQAIPSADASAKNTAPAAGAREQVRTRRSGGAQPSPEPLDWRAYVAHPGEPPRLSQEAIDHWLERNRTNAESLLAIRQAGGGSDYLREALRLYPNDPAVLMASLILDDSAEAKRERLDRLKTASPDNALPYYLSAREHLKQSQPEKAIADLVAASGLNRFDDYTVQAMQAAEELYLASGHSPASAKVLGGSSVLLPHLSQLKGLTTDIMDLRQQYLAAGDSQSADNLARYMLQLGDELVTGEGSRFLINQMVGTAIQQITLNKLDPNQNYSFLSTSVADRKAQLTAFRDESKQDGKFLEQLLATADDERVISYFERIKLYGERSAIEWWKTTQ